MNHILAVACASITGITLGIALHHKMSLGTTQPSAATHLSPVQQSEDDSYLSELSLSGTSQRFDPNSMIATHAASSSPLEMKFNKLVEQQETMSSQQSELNRELNAMQFRLDTHSASFRPLRSERETKDLSPSMNNGPLTPLLPPRQ